MWNGLGVALLLTFFAVGVSVPLPARAADIMMKGIMTGPKGGARGVITIDGNSITVEKKGLFKQSTISYRFGEMSSVTVQTAFLRKGNIVIELVNHEQPLRLIVRGKQAKDAREYLKRRIAG